MTGHSKPRILAIAATLAVSIGCSRPTSPASQQKIPTVTVVPSSGEGEGVSYVVTVTPGAQRTIGLLMNKGIDARAACYILYDVARNTFNLVNDSGIGSKMPGNGDSAVENSQCALEALNTMADSLNGTLKLQFALTFKPAFAGGKFVYVYTEKPGTPGRFQAEGAWMVSE